MTFLAVISYEQSMDDHHIGPLDLPTVATGILFVGSNCLVVTSIISHHIAVLDSQPTLEAFDFRTVYFDSLALSLLMT